jgi:uncharacterized BrkB/YihY/UPF0761 family membrane protein
VRTEDHPSPIRSVCRNKHFQNGSKIECLSWELLAYYTVFSLAPLVLLLVAIVGFLFHNDPAGAWRKMTEQMSYFLDKSAVDAVEGIAQKASQPNKGLLAPIIGVWLALVVEPAIS